MDRITRMSKFTLLDLFWLVLVVAMGLGWLMDRHRMERQYDELRRRYLGLIDDTTEFRRHMKMEFLPPRD